MKFANKSYYNKITKIVPDIVCMSQRKGDAFLTMNDKHVKKIEAKEMHEECRRHSAVNAELDKHEFLLCT